MNKTKSLYEAPTTDVLVVRFEGVVCTSPGPRGTAGNVFDGSNINDYEDDVL